MLRNLKARPLKRIPEPTKEVVEWQILSRGLDGEDELAKARKTMRKTFPDYLDVLKDYNKKLERVLSHNVGWAEIAIALNQIEFEGEGISPIEKKERVEADHKKHGRVEWGLVVGFEHLRVDEKIKRKLVYMTLGGVERKKEVLEAVREADPTTLFEIKEGPKGYPEDWDEEGKEMKEGFDDTF